MSKIEVSLSNNKLKIELSRARQTPEDVEIIDISKMPIYRRHLSSIPVKSNTQKNKILLVEEIASNETLVVFTTGVKVCYHKYPTGEVSPLAPLIQIKSKVVWMRFTARKLKLVYAAYILNPYKLPISEQYCYIDEDNKQKASLASLRSKPSKLSILRHHLRTVSFSKQSLIAQEDMRANLPVRIRLIVDGKRVDVSLQAEDAKIKDPRFYYVPSIRTRLRDYSMHIRRSDNASVLLVRRKLEDVEKTFMFRVLESRLISFLFYYTARLAKKISSKKVNLLYEKFAAKADEGAFEVFEECNRVKSTSNNYFIIEKGTAGYEKLRDVPGVVANYSVKSYWLVYRADNLIATEAPAHLNILRSNNKHLRRALYEKKFIFLQHGVTYLKSQGKTSAFRQGKDAEPYLMAVSSEKEQDVLVDMLNLPEERFLKVGLPVFDNAEYQHITQKSPDIATVMLTWKPYEEHLTDFTKTTYYKNTIEVSNLLAELLPLTQIRVVAHPKVARELRSTDLKDSLWDGLVSDVLSESKLVITDYSSVCYNSFYQGGATIFYQPDLERYQAFVGELIPKDEEYIGERVYDMQRLREILERTVKGGEIDLAQLRTTRHIDNYQSINPFHDGKNVKRLCAELKRKGIV